MTNKMTKKDYFNTLLTIADVKANEEISEKILEVLDKPMTATDIMKAVQPFVDVELSNQKISALLRLLGEKGTGQVKKTVDKRKSYFERV